MAKPTWNEIDARVARIIAEDKGYHVTEIHDNDRLRDDLRYDDAGLRALAPDINRAFFKDGKGLSGKTVVNCLKVIGIVARVDEQPVNDFK